MVKNTKGKVVAHICRGSRKDLRNTIEAARKACDSWAQRSAYNRGQILYRMAEMMEGRRSEFIEAICETGGATPAAARREVDTSIDRMVCFAGWTDKLSSVLGSHNQVGGPYYNFTIPEPTGVVGVIAPHEPALLGLVSLIAPIVCAGNVAVVLASEKHPLPACLLGEVCATSDVPSGVVNIITGRRTELLVHFAQHRDLNALSAANLTKAQAAMVKRESAESVKRVQCEKIKPDEWFDGDKCESPWTIEPFVDLKTIWHPSAM